MLRLVQVDAGHVIAPVTQGKRDQTARAATELHRPLVRLQVVTQPVQALKVPVDVLSRNEVHQVRERATLTKRSTSAGRGRMAP